MASRLLLAAVLVSIGGCAPRKPAPPARLPQVPVTSTADRSRDPELEEAMAKAQSTLGGFISRLHNPQRGETFSIEGQFQAEDDTPLYLWLGDVTYSNGKFKGSLTSHPKKASKLRFGDPAEVPKAEVTDWMILKGGRTEGGFTIDILMSREAAPR
jgi:uncharacterized protein YegJ (DUF2314 family)